MSKNILLGITSSIASYKAYELIRQYKKCGFNVKTIISKNALNFVSPLVLETLTGERCCYEQFIPRDNTQHINLCDWADVFVVAPLSANTISKFAQGICDNLLTSVFCAYLGTKKPILLAPAMNANMWNNPLIQKNLQILKDFNCEIVDVEKGFLACGTEDIGRLASIDKIYMKTHRLVEQDKKNNSKKVIITIGGTQENIDEVRFISNASSGKMGYCLADCAYFKGYDVCAVATIKKDKPYKVLEVKTALDILETLKNENFDYLIMAAAVGDFRVENQVQGKIKKEELETLELKLIKNPDVVAEISENKAENQTIIGFSLADNDIEQTAIKKLKSKNLDFIIANKISALNNDKNMVTIFDKNGKITDIETNSKENIAQKILEVCFD